MNALRVKIAFRLFVLLLVLSFVAFLTLNLLTRQRRVSQSEAIADVQQFFSTLQRVHPDLLAKVSLEDYIKLKQQTLDSVSKRLDRNGKISASDLAYSLCYAAAFFQDGHTSVQWYTSDSSGKRLPPFLLRYDNGRFVIVASSDKAIEGLEVLSVNGCSTQEYLRPILDRISGETLVWKACLFCEKQQFWYCFTNLCGSNQSLDLRLRDASGRASKHTVDTVDGAAFRRISCQAHVSKLEQMRQQGTRVEFLDSDRTAHFIYPKFNLSDDEKKNVDSIFEQIKAKKSRELIIDLRGNGGGNSAMGDFIFSYLYGKPFCSFSKARIKLSRDVLSSKLKDQKVLSDLEGLTVTFMSGKEESVAKPNAFFSGRTFLLVDNGTFSSAADFTAMFRDYGVGTILGYETGGLPVCFGDVFPFTLANSGIRCGVSYKQFFGPKPRPGDDEHGVVPDIPMTDKLLRAYQKEDDPVLAYTLDHIKKTPDRPAIPLHGGRVRQLRCPVPGNETTVVASLHAGRPAPATGYAMGVGLSRPAPVLIGWRLPDASLLQPSLQNSGGDKETLRKSPSQLGLAVVG